MTGLASSGESFLINLIGRSPGTIEFGFLMYVTCRTLPSHPKLVLIDNFHPVLIALEYLEGSFEC